MALPRATQSAIWYYLSCTPCAESRYRKKLKEKSERDRIEREAMYNMMPHVYRHPSPSGTNAHWQTEIETGPHMISRGKKKPNTSDTRGRSLTQHSNGSNGLNSLDLSSSNASRDGRNDSKFDFKQYQRDNEPEGFISMDRVSTNGSVHSHTIARPPKARMRGSDNEVSYARYKNPQLNDLHPATVTKFISREEARFMLKALPDPDFMKGKGLSATRSRSDSGDSSRLSVRSPVPLSREVSHKIVESKLKTAEESLSPSLSRGSSSRTPNGSTSHQQSRAKMDEKDFAQVDNDSSNNQEQQASPVQIHVSDNSDESAVTVVRNLNMAPEPLRKQQSRKVASKPQLSTIVSDSVSPSDEDDQIHPERPKENSDPSPRQSENSISERNRISRRSPVLAKDDSLQILRDLAPHSKIFNTKVVSTDDLLKASKKPSRLPSQGSEDRNPDFDPEIFESWDSADFALPEWIHEHTKREVKQRWSMEI